MTKVKKSRIRLSLKHDKNKKYIKLNFLQDDKVKMTCKINELIALYRLINAATDFVYKKQGLTDEFDTKVIL